MPQVTLTAFQLEALKIEARKMAVRHADEILGCTASDDSLTCGNLGLLIYHFSLYQALGKDKHAQKGLDIAYGIFDRLNDSQTLEGNYSYAGGICGLARSIDFLIRGDILPADMNKEIIAFDGVLYRQAVSMIQAKQNDFLHSSLGIIAFFADRLPDPIIFEKLEHLLDVLLNTINETDDHCWIDNFFTDKRDGTMINLSLSHGQCSFLIILLRLYQKGLKTDRLYQVISKGINFIISTRIEIGSHPNNCSVFPSMTGSDGTRNVVNNRLAWCYGDLNEVYLLYVAGQILYQPGYTSIADIVGTLSTARTSFEHTRCKDSNFCHGSAGLAQFYNTLYQLQPADTYRNAYYFWIQQTLKFLKKEMEENYYRSKETRFLEGLLGPAMVLLSFSYDKSYDWPELFLLQPHKPIPVVVQE